MLPHPKLTCLIGNGCHTSSTSNYGLSTVSLCGPQHGANSSPFLRLTSRARSQRFSSHDRASMSALGTDVTHEDAKPSLQVSRQASIPRPRLQRAILPLPPSQQVGLQQPWQPQQLAVTVAGGPRVGAAASHPRTPVQANKAASSAAPGHSAKMLAPAAGRQGFRQQQQQAPPPQGQRGHVAVGEHPLQSRHMGFSLRTGLALTWLGTNSGTPTLERNVSCTLVRLPGAVHVVDCGEGTHRQLLSLEDSLDLAEVDGIFITHLHGDHCFGLPAALAVLDRAKAAGQTDPARRRHYVYGPPGLAELVRVSMISTGLARRLQLPVLISELVCSPAAAHPPQPLAQAFRQQQRRRGGDERDCGGSGDSGVQVLLQRVAARRVQDAPELTAAVHAVQPRVAALEEIWSPLPRRQPYVPYGRHGTSYSGSDSELLELTSSTDEDADEAGGGGGAPFRFVAAEGLFWELPGCAGFRVRAAQLQHRVPCWGYVFTEARPYEEGMRRRKVVVLGDTVSSRPIAPLAVGCDVISHEATFARGMEAKARIAQHSTGWMAGAFAAAVGARSLVLTHFSARYREGPRDGDLSRSSRASGQQEAEQQSWAVAGLLKEAAATYGRPDHIFAASDFYSHHVPPRPLVASAASSGPGGERSTIAAVDTEGLSEGTDGDAASRDVAAVVRGRVGPAGEHVARGRLLRRAVGERQGA